MSERASKESSKKSTRSRGAKAAKALKLMEQRRNRVAESKSLKTSEQGDKKSSLLDEVKVIQENSLNIPSAPSDEMLRSFREEGRKARQKLREAETKRSKRGAFLFKPGRKGRKYTLDLRIHTPGTVGYFATGGVDPSKGILRLAKAKGLDIIGLTDFYNASLVDRVCSEQKRDKANKLTVFPGVDLRCRLANCDELFLSVFFEEKTPAEHIFDLLEALEVPSEYYGNPNYILELSLDEVISEVEARNGVIIPSQIDKTPYRMLTIRPLVEDYGFHAFDMVYPENVEFFREKWPDGEFSFFSFSNAQSLAQIGSRAAKLKLAEKNFAGLVERMSRREVG